MVWAVLTSHPRTVQALSLESTAGFASFGLDTPGAVIDSANGFAYLGGANRVFRISLSDISNVQTLTLQPGETGISCALLDSPGGYAYFGLQTSPVQIV